MVRKRESRATRHGYNMVEVVVSTLIIGLVMVGAMTMLGNSMQSRASSVARVDGPGLASHLLAEVLSMPYEDPEEPGNAIGLDTDESDVNRATFDDIDDYAGWDVSPPQAKGGTVLDGFSSWRRQVSVSYVDPSNLEASPSDTGVKLIVVSVTSPTSETDELSALRSRSGSLERPPAVDTTMLTWMGAELELGANSEKAVSGVDFHNHVEELAP